MHEQNIVVTCNISSEQKALLLEILGSDATLTFLDKIPSTLHDQALEKATVLLVELPTRDLAPALSQLAAGQVHSARFCGS